MSHFDQNYKIVKDKEEELYFKVYAMYVDNRIIDNVTCVLLDKDNIIKEVKPIEIQDDGVYFMLGNDIPKGEYIYKVIGNVEGDNRILIDRREIKVI